MVNFIEKFVQGHEKFDEASMKRRWNFDDGFFVAMCKWALRIDTKTENNQTKKQSPQWFIKVPNNPNPIL